MEKAARILSTVGFVFLVMELSSDLLVTAIFAIPAILQSYDESMTVTAVTLAVIFGILSGLAIIALPAAIVGKNKLYDAPGEGSGALLFSGILSFNAFLILSGIFGMKARHEIQRKR